MCNSHPLGSSTTHKKGAGSKHVLPQNVINYIQSVRQLIKSDHKTNLICTGIHINRCSKSPTSLRSNQQMRQGSSMIYWCIPNFYPNMFQQFIAIIRGRVYLRSYSSSICVVVVHGLRFVQCGQLSREATKRRIPRQHLLVISQRYYKMLDPTIKLLLHISAFNGCHHQGVLIMVKAVLSKSTTITHFYTYVVSIHVSIHGARNNKTEPVSVYLISDDKSFATLCCIWKRYNKETWLWR
jgi:hypothetical protein